MKREERGEERREERGEERRGERGEEREEERGERNCRRSLYTFLRYSNADVTL